MSDQYTIDHIKDRYLVMTDEITRLRAENEKLREKLVNVLIDEEFDFDFLDDEQRRDITLKTLKSSYEDIFSAYAGSTNEEDKQYCQDMLDTLDKTIELFSNQEEFEDWNNEKAEFAAIREDKQ